MPLLVLDKFRKGSKCCNTSLSNFVFNPNAPHHDWRCTYNQVLTCIALPTFNTNKNLHTCLYPGSVCRDGSWRHSECGRVECCFVEADRRYAVASHVATTGLARSFSFLYSASSQPTQVASEWALGRYEDGMTSCRRCIVSHANTFYDFDVFLVLFGATKDTARCFNFRFQVWTFLS